MAEKWGYTIADRFYLTQYVELALHNWINEAPLAQLSEKYLDEGDLRDVIDLAQPIL